MKNDEKRPQKYDEVFREETYLRKGGEEQRIPDKEEILRFLKLIYQNAKLTAECAIMAMAYIERFLTLTDITFHPSNWRLICLGAVMVARKVWIDKSRVSNLNFVQIFPYLTIDDLANLEREYLTRLQFVVSLKPSLYAKYYFALSSIAEKDEKNFPEKPLSRSDEERLEDLMHHIERITPRRRCVSGGSNTNSPNTSPSASQTNIKCRSKTHHDHRVNRALNFESGKCEC